MKRNPRRTGLLSGCCAVVCPQRGSPVHAGPAGAPRTNLSAFLGEALARKGRTSAYARLELLNIETEHLLFPTVVHRPHPGELIDRLNAYTVGAVRDVSSARRFSLGIGGDVTFYNVPARLQPFYGDRPVSFHVFARVRPRGGRFMRMWNMTMTAPMRHSGISMP